MTRVANIASFGRLMFMLSIGASSASAFAKPDHAVFQHVAWLAGSGMEADVRAGGRPDSLRKQFVNVAPGLVSLVKEADAEDSEQQLFQAMSQYLHYTFPSVSLDAMPMTEAGAPEYVLRFAGADAGPEQRVSLGGDLRQWADAPASAQPLDGISWMAGDDGGDDPPPPPYTTGLGCTDNGTCTSGTICTSSDICTNKLGCTVGSCTSSSECTSQVFCTGGFKGCTLGDDCTSGGGCTSSSNSCTSSGLCTQGSGSCTQGGTCTGGIGSGCTSGKSCTNSGSCTAGSSCTKGGQCTGDGNCTSGEYCTSGSGCTASTAVCTSFGTCTQGDHCTTGRSSGNGCTAIQNNCTTGGKNHCTSSQNPDCPQASDGGGGGSAAMSSWESVASPANPIGAMLVVLLLGFGVMFHKPW